MQLAHILQLQVTRGSASAFKPKTRSSAGRQSVAVSVRLPCGHHSHTPLPGAPKNFSKPHRRSLGVFLPPPPSFSPSFHRLQTHTVTWGPSAHFCLASPFSGPSLPAHLLDILPGRCYLLTTGPRREAGEASHTPTLFPHQLRVAPGFFNPQTFRLGLPCTLAEQALIVLKKKKYSQAEKQREIGRAHV